MIPYFFYRLDEWVYSSKLIRIKIKRVTVIFALGYYFVALFRWLLTRGGRVPLWRTNLGCFASIKEFGAVAFYCAEDLVQEFRQCSVGGMCAITSRTTTSYYFISPQQDDSLPLCYHCSFDSSFRMWRCRLLISD